MFCSRCTLSCHSLADHSPKPHRAPGGAILVSCCLPRSLALSLSPHLPALSRHAAPLLPQSPPRRHFSPHVDASQAQARKANFDRALEKANYASLALRPSEGAAGAAGGDDEDDELFQSLERARAAALKAGAAKESLEGVAQALVRKREEEEKKEAGEAAGKKGIVIDGAIEFVRCVLARRGTCVSRLPLSTR